MPLREDSQLPLVEITPVPDKFVQGMDIEPVGAHCVRVIYWSIQTEPDGTQYRLVVSKHVVPRENYGPKSQSLAAYKAFFADTPRGEPVHTD